MFVKLLGLVDFIAAIFMLLLHFNVVSWRVCIGIVFYLFFKAYMFKGDFNSILDFLVGVYLIMMLFGLRSVLDFVFIFYLGQKAFFSFV